MKFSKKTRWTILTAAIGIPLLFVTYTVASFLGIPLPGNQVEITETLATVHDAYGNTFEVTETNYDGIAKEDWISVYVSPEKSSIPFLQRWHSHKTLLFQYDPEDETVPIINRVNAHSIRIAVPLVSSVGYQSHNWKGIAIEYEIGCDQSKTENGCPR